MSNRCFQIESYFPYDIRTAKCIEQAVENIETIRLWKSTRSTAQLHSVYCPKT